MRAAWLHGPRDLRVVEVDVPEPGPNEALVSIPPGWRGSGKAHYHHCYEEAFVMDGDVTLTGREDLFDGSYLYRPASSTDTARVRAAAGTRLLVWRNTDRG